MEQKRILIVDDEQDLCEILCYNLTAAGYQAEVAYSAEMAIEKGVAQYDLLLLDVMMPGMSGFELARQLKGDEATASPSTLTDLWLRSITKPSYCKVLGLPASTLSLRQSTAFTLAITSRTENGFFT